MLNRRINLAIAKVDAWTSYFRTRPHVPKEAPVALQDLEVLVEYIHYLKRMNDVLLRLKEPLWDLPSAVIGFGLGVVMTLVILSLRGALHFPS